jgi:hypothetical protein
LSRADATENPVLRDWERPERIADYITAHMFEVSPRTLAEKWKVPYAVINGRRHLNTAKTLECAARLKATATASPLRNDATLFLGPLPVPDGSDTARTSARAAAKLALTNRRAR